MCAAEPVAIVEASMPDEIAEIRTLFSEYQQWLGEDLSFQDFAAELDSLPVLYAPPGGLLLARGPDGSAAGGVGMKALEPGICEMKRLMCVRAGAASASDEGCGGHRAGGRGCRLRDHASRHACAPA